MNRLPQVLRWLLGNISDMCLGTYLLSWIPDNNIYTYLNANVPVVADRMKYFFLIPLAVFILATAGSLVIYLLSKLIHRLIPIKELLLKREEQRSILPVSEEEQKTECTVI